MKYQATITVEFDAEDIYAEHRHKTRLEAVLVELGADYATPALGIRARRKRNKPRAPMPAKLGEGIEIVRALYVG
jgi:hypothetical protein